MSLSLRPNRAAGGAPTRRLAPIWIVAAVAGWAGVAWLGVQLYASTPPRAGFDLELLLRAGRRVAEGAGPYDPAMLAGQAPSAVDLFYSYPPPVAQYLSLFAGVPSPVMLVVFGLLAVAGVLAAALALGRVGDFARAPSVSQTLRSVGLPVIAIVPFVFPFAIAILFGNLDALFPLLYGVMLLGALGTTLASRFSGGAALAIAAVTKVHPASMGLWFLVRGLRNRRRTGAHGASSAPGAWVVVAAAAAVLLAILLVSVAAGGVTPWLDYVNVLRAGSAANVIDPRNAGPAAQFALMTGGSESLAHTLQLAVTAIALVLTAAAAWLRDDTLESFAWATVVSLIILPVTWFHYPVALIPVALVAWLRADAAARRPVAALLGGAILVGVLAVVAPVFVWIAVGLVLIAVHRSIPIGAATAPYPTLEPARITRFPLPGSRS